MRSFALIAILVLFFPNLSAGLIPPLDGPCPGGTYPTVYTSCEYDSQCPYRQYCFIQYSLHHTGFCCPYPPKPYY